jgi:hypothetical protein
MALIEARFKLEQETKGAVRYQEVDEKGEPEQISAKSYTFGRQPSNAVPRFRRSCTSPSRPCQRRNSRRG